MGRGSNDWVGVGEVADELTQIANQYSLPVVAAAQLNRQGISESAGLETLAEADKIGQNASGVVFVRPQSASVIKYNVKKYRNGESDFGWWTRFTPDRGIFHEIDYDTAQEQIIQDQEEAADL